MGNESLEEVEDYGKGVVLLLVRQGICWTWAEVHAMREVGEA
jgi:hypothetical protein